MNIGEVKILIKDSESNLRDILLNNIKDLYYYNKIKIYLEKDLKNLNEIKPDLIILEFVDRAKLINDIEDIHFNYSDLRNKIIVMIERNRQEELVFLINLGIREFIFKPFIDAEVTLRINNCINYILAVRQSINKEIQFNALLNNTPYMAWFKDRNSNYIIANDDFKHHSGKTSEEINGRDDKFVWDGKIGEMCRVYDLKVMDERKQIIFNEIIPGKKGNREFSIYKAPVTDEANNVIGTIGVARDITEIKNKDNQLRIILENIPFTVILSDVNGVILEINNSNIFHGSNVSRESIIGTRGEDLLYEKNISTEFLDLQAIQNNKVKAMKKSLEYETCIAVENKEYIAKIYKEPIFDIENNVSGILTLINDITEERRYQENIKSLAITDSLTGVGNRRLLYSLLQDKINKKENLTLGFIDLDNFKKINDIYGHNYGDYILKLFVNKLKEICNGSLIARVGGDEFVVVYNNVFDSQILNKNINTAFNKMKDIFEKHDKAKILSVSMGVVTENGEGTSIEELMSKGDFALYKAKEQGKNRYVFYNKELKRENMFNIQMESDLVNCIENDEIKLFYQPQYSINKELKGFEALFRWDNEKYKNVPVYKVIKIMENSNLMLHIGECILEKAFKFSNKINKELEKPVTISVNISPRQIMSENFIDIVKEIIDKTKVKTETIVFEVTENVFIDNIEDSINKLTKIKELGISISLDDFGTGYSSLNYLVKLPIDELKIDRSFITGINDNDKYVDIIKHITELAHTISLLVVVEGIEYKDELEKMEKIGIDYIQGYLFNKPMEESEIFNMIKNNSN